MTSSLKLPREHIRLKIQTLYKEGYTVKQISEKTKTSFSTVNRWKKMKKIHDKKRSGRPKKLSSLEKKAIMKNIYGKMGSSVRKITNVLNGSKRNIEINKKFCHSTLQTYLKNYIMGKNTYKNTLNPKLSVKDRLEFGKMLEERAYLTCYLRGKKLRSNIFFYK